MIEGHQILSISSRINRKEAKRRLGDFVQGLFPFIAIPVLHPALFEVAETNLEAVLSMMVLGSRRNSTLSGSIRDDCVSLGDRGFPHLGHVAIDSYPGRLVRRISFSHGVPFPYCSGADEWLHPVRADCLKWNGSSLGL